jgi:glyoxylate/hydroxypyruvate reductase
MKIVFTSGLDATHSDGWRQALHAALPEAQWLNPEDARSQGGHADAAVVANPPPGSLAGLHGLRLIQGLWAGVDRLLADPTLPTDVPLARMVDPAMSDAMAETALWAVLSLHRGFFVYAQRQAKQQWRAHLQRRADEVQVLILGTGSMGQAVFDRLAPLGYRLHSWRRSDGPHALALAQAQAHITINLLPLTPATEALLNAPFFNALPKGASLVNLARGAHVVDTDLLAALNSGHLRHAVLDVFHEEPLSTAHPYWRHPQVTVLPHMAAQTDPRSAAVLVAANLRALRDGLPLQYLVDRARGY